MMSPDDLALERQRELLSPVPGDAGVALRFVTALCEEDASAANTAITEIATSPRWLNVTAIMASMLSRSAHYLAARSDHDALAWLHVVAPSGMDEVEHHKAIGGDTPPAG